MTVCIATLFQWNYAPRGEDIRLGIAALTATDRMITAGDVQYEPPQLKLAQITPRILILIAGDYSLHSQAIKDTERQVAGNPSPTPSNVAAIYGQSIQGINQKQAEDLYLAPLGMNNETFLAQQRDMSDSFVASITNQMQTHHPQDVEALVIGSDAKTVQLYHVDERGTARCFDDVGFAAIGIGASHANSSLMQAGYTKSLFMPPALASIYSAKKSAEVAPGVGSATDMHILTINGWFPVWPEVFSKMQSLYDEYDKGREGLAQAGIDQLRQFLGERAEKETDDDGRSAEADAGDAQEASKTPQPDEGGKEPQASRE